jgi:hypothetical protein
MRIINKVCARCGTRFRATCGVEKFCSDRCKFEESYVVAETGCWLWRYTLDKNGYGYIKLKGARRTRKAHRFSYELKHGNLTDQSVMVCHSCDVPSCVNPAHLFLGTARRNKQDSVDKKRHVHGVGVYWKAKLTEAQARDILQDGRSAPVIAAEYGLHRNSIYAIRKRKIWKHLTA